jgi:hypothetical protein
VYTRALGPRAALFSVRLCARMIMRAGAFVCVRACARGRPRAGGLGHAPAAHGVTGCLPGARLGPDHVAVEGLVLRRRRAGSARRLHSAWTKTLSPSLPLRFQHAGLRPTRVSAEPSRTRQSADLRH